MGGEESLGEAKGWGDEGSEACSGTEGGFGEMRRWF